jgi:putative FmdB family regulatory protein
MVTYRYSCEKCGNEFDCEQRITDPPRKRCPRCQGSVYRVIQPVSHILKGSGFYRTDYRSANFKKREKEESVGPPSHTEKETKKHEPKAKPDKS